MRRWSVHYDWEAVQSLAISVLAQAVQEARKSDEAREFLFSDDSFYIRELWCDVAGVNVESFQEEAKRRIRGIEP